MIRKLSIFVLFIIVCVSVNFWGDTVSTALAATEKFQKTYEVQPGTPLEVSNKNGSVAIRGWDKSYVEVVAEKRTTWTGDLKDVTIEVTTGDTLIIKTVYLTKHPRVSVKYDISVPEHVVVKQISTSNGAIKLEGTQGDVLAETSNGEIEIESVVGDVEAKTSNGKIEVKHIDGYVTTKTSNGAIEIEEVAGIVSAQTSNGKIRAEIPEVQENIRIETSNGAIELYIPSNLHANIEMKTSNGKIAVKDIEIITSEISKTALKGRIGNGGKRIDIKTSNGSIELHKLE